ncbi:MAG TPA: hypothetical protein VMH28_17980 [Candidatus Acidoferrales bacterium]|nr:hypothetical protein [Candidatus Acidoferrales bacterium]
MELQDIPVADTPENEAVPSIEDSEMDRIAFELWQRGSLPELAEGAQADLEEVASHSSCL